jgi:Na+/H+ antiporter NhaD/arsenite permease-like protein
MEHHVLNLINHPMGYLCIAIFVIAYALVMTEEFSHLRKSKPVLLGAGIIWAIVAALYVQHGDKHSAEAAVRHNLLEWGELFIFLLAAMTYVNAMTERNIFEALRSWLVKKGFSLRKLFWITGVLAFFISPIADNLTTALLMCSVVLAVGGTNTKFIGIACINIVVAANAGGAFSPFGDITTLMVWQKGHVDFFTFFLLFIPSVVNWIIPAFIMSFWVPKIYPEAMSESIYMKRGAKTIILLLFCTIATAVSFHQFLGLPPALGMMTGLAYLKFYGYYLKKSGEKMNGNENGGTTGDEVAFDSYKNIARAE